MFDKAKGGVGGFMGLWGMLVVIQVLVTALVGWVSGVKMLVMAGLLVVILWLIGGRGWRFDRSRVYITDQEAIRVALAEMLGKMSIVDKLCRQGDGYYINYGYNKRGNWLQVRSQITAHKSKRYYFIAKL